MIQAASATSGANAAVSVTLAGVEDQRHQVFQVTWSYDAAPTGGRLSSTGLRGDEHDHDITAAGPGSLPLPPAWGDLGKAVTYTLAAGGGSVVGKLSIYYRTA